jgi:hypothetical protein
VIFLENYYLLFVCGVFLFLGCGKKSDLLSCEEVLKDLKVCDFGEIGELESECQRLEETYRSDVFESYILCLKKLSCVDLGLFKECRGISVRGISSDSYHVDFCRLWCEKQEECKSLDLSACQEDCQDSVKVYSEEVISSARSCVKYSCDLAWDCVEDTFQMEEEG